jgi:hypothetical protein
MRRSALFLATLMASLVTLGLGAARADAPARIAAAFVDLGMAQSKAVCYGGVVGEQLSQEEADRAAAVIEAADDGEEVREGLSQTSGNIITVFSFARNKCGY